MTDARIVATNPADSSVVAVACNENGELLLADSSLTQFVKKAGDKMEGSLEVTEKIKLGSDGSAYFSGQGVTFDADGDAEFSRSFTCYGRMGGSSKVTITNPANKVALMGYNVNNDLSFKISTSDGSALFHGEVVVGSRNSKWTIVESGGLAHLVEYSSFQAPADKPVSRGTPDQYPALRNIPQELDLVEQALSEVMERLRMNPPAGFPVWDGSDES